MGLPGRHPNPICPLRPTCSTEAVPDMSAPSSPLPPLRSHSLKCLCHPQTLKSLSCIVNYALSVCPWSFFPSPKLWWPLLMTITCWLVTSLMTWLVTFTLFQRGLKAVSSFLWVNMMSLVYFCFGFECCLSIQSICPSRTGSYNLGLQWECLPDVPRGFSDPVQILLNIEQRAHDPIQISSLWC